MQFLRLLNKGRPKSLLSLYISFIPYISFHILCRNAHMPFTVLWFLSILTIHLQKGSEKLTKHIFISVFVYMAVYAGTTSLTKYYQNSYSYTPLQTANMYTFTNKSTATGSIYLWNHAEGYRFNNFGPCNVSQIAPIQNITLQNIILKNVTQSWNGLPPQVNCYINVPDFILKGAAEATFGISIALIGIAIFMLQRFIQEYASSLLDRKKHVKNLATSSVFSF